MAAMMQPSAPPMSAMPAVASATSQAPIFYGQPVQQGLAQQYTTPQPLQPTISRGEARKSREELAQRAAEFMAGGATVLFSITVALSWSLAHGLNVGTTALNAIGWLQNMGWITAALDAVTLGWCVNDAARTGSEGAANKFAGILQAASFAITTIMVGGVMRSISLVSVYQKGEGNPTINSASVTTWFTWGWCFIWLCMKSWNDVHNARSRRTVPELPLPPQTYAPSNSVAQGFPAMAQPFNGNGMKQPTTARYRI